MQIVQQAKINSYITEMNENVNSMKELMVFTKNFNTEFKNQILNFGKKLKDLNTEVGSLEKRIVSLDNVANNLTVANNKQKIDTNNELLKQILKNSTQEIMKNYQNLIKTEISKLNVSIQHLANSTRRIDIKEHSKKSVTSQKTKTAQHSDNNKKEGKKKSKTKKMLKKNNDKINTEEIKANTFANEDAFDDSVSKVSSSSESQPK